LTHWAFDFRISTAHGNHNNYQAVITEEVLLTMAVETVIVHVHGSPQLEAVIAIPT